MFNVIQNAVKYNCPKGDILILMMLSEGRTKLMIEVIDTGCGIKADIQQYLFKPFEELKQLQDFKKVQNMSLGLGLACSH